MIKISARARAIKPSPTLGMAAEAAAMRAAGKDIVDLSAGEPDFDTPEHVKAAAAEAMRRGATKYTAVGGTEELRDAIRDKLRRENGLAYGRSEVIASCGGKHALFNVFMALLDEGDEVVLPAPYWVSYLDIMVLAGAVPRIIQTTAARNFRMSAEELDAACGPRTVGVVLNSPSNPTGAVYSAEELRAIGQVALRRGLVIFSDDIYEHLVDHPVAHIGTLVPELRPQLVVLNAVSKTYAMTGWRIGYAAAPADVVRAMTALQSQSTSNPTSIAQAAAIAALNGPQECVAAMAKEFRARRERVLVLLNAIPGVHTTVPEGAFYFFPDVSAYFGRRGPTGRIDSAGGLAEYLLRHAGLAVVAGEAFGAPNHVRLSYAAPLQQIEEGVRRLRTALLDLS